MNKIKLTGLIVFIFCLGLFISAITLSHHKLNDNSLTSMKKHHGLMLKEIGKEIINKEYNSNFAFIKDIKQLLVLTKDSLDRRCGIDPENNIWSATILPEGVGEWDYRMSDYDIKKYTVSLTKDSSIGLLPENSGLFFFLIFILGSIGALLYILSDLKSIPGIKNNNIFHNPVTKGLTQPLQILLVFSTLLTTFYILHKYEAWLYLNAALSFTAIVLIMIFIKEWKRGIKPWQISNSSIGSGWVSIVIGTFLISFYIILYFYPQYITNWILLVDPIKRYISGGNPADQWFLYGLLYCLVMMVMGVRMLVKYRHNKYQLVRTCSVIFFQLTFAFLLPEILGRLNYPAMDLKEAWPLDYDFYHDYNISNKLDNQAGYFLGMHVGTLMFVWGIILTLVIVPLFTYLFGKRWYCSWVCGCGGLAETLGDPFRQQSDKSLRAWQIERYLIHSVLVFVVVMSAFMIYHYNSGIHEINFLGITFNAYAMREWYGFLIGSVFAGVVGTGFYPIMGNRMWCRYGCPLAALMGIVQKFKSRFRITTNGGQCISCGNCSTYCEMGIDVRYYAQRGQDIVRASCVGCGICSAVCPRGVLKLENSSADVSERTIDIRNNHIEMDKI